MIAGLRGCIRRLEPGRILLSVGPVEVQVSVPVSCTARLTMGQEIELRTHLHVREDQLALFGFMSHDELEIFELLLSVSGVGPKAAMSLLSALAPPDIRRAVLDGNPQALARAPGVGSRAANRIITDLRSRIGADAEFPSTMGEPRSGALTALVSMGYSAVEARSAIDQAPDGDSVEEVLRQALAVLAER